MSGRNKHLRALEDFFFGFTAFTALGSGALLVASLSAGARTALAADPPLHTSPKSVAEVAPLVEGFSSDPLDRQPERIAGQP